MPVPFTPMHCDKNPQKHTRNPRKPLVTLALPQRVRKLVQRTPDELRLLPQVGSQEAVRVGHGRECCLERVFERLGRAGRRGVGILDASELEEALDGGGGDQAGTAGSGDEL